MIKIKDKYCTIRDIKEKMTEAELIRLTNFGDLDAANIDEKVLDLLIKEVSLLINKFINISLIAEGELFELNRIAVNMAVFKLYERYDFSGSLNLVIASNYYNSFGYLSDIRHNCTRREVNERNKED